jgi:hypothetical protein
MISQTIDQGIYNNQVVETMKEHNLLFPGEEKQMKEYLFQTI